MENETVTISKKDYEKLIEDQFWLNCLESAGVDNWDGYDEAIELFKQDEE